MLSEQEAAALQNSAARVGERVQAELRARPGVEYALTFVENLHRSMDKTIRQANERGQPMECQAGCASCCSVRVEVSPVEALWLARQLRAWPEARQQALHQRLQQRLTLFEMTMETSPRRECVLLENNLCSVYAWRPASCRKAHSFSATACQSQAATIPQDLAITMAAEALQRGMAQGYRLAGLPSAPMELTAALQWALSCPDVEAAWYHAARE